MVPELVSKALIKVALSVGNQSLKSFLSDFYRQRSEERLQSFLLQLAKMYSVDIDGKDENKFQELIGRFDNDADLQDAMNVAIRSVSFGRSRSIGPRLAAWTLNIIEQRGGPVSDVEEVYFAAAEKLGDRELLWFSEHYLMPPKKCDLSDSMNSAEEAFSRKNSILIFYNQEPEPSGIVPALVSCGLAISNVFGEQLEDKNIESLYVRSYSEFRPFAEAINKLQ